MRKSALLGVLAGGRYSRQILSYAAGAAGISTAGSTSLAVPWPTAAGAVAGNVRNMLVVALKPGTANLGAVATPSGWTLVGGYIGGGYGGTAGGNSRVYLFSRDGDNTVSGNVAVTLTPDGSNGVASGSISRFEKTKGNWQPLNSVAAEATVNGLVGTYAPGALVVSPGDVLVYGLALHDATFTSITLAAEPTQATMSPAGALSWGQTTGYGVAHLLFPKRVKRGGVLGAATVTLGNGDCRGPLIVARLRVR